MCYRLRLQAITFLLCFFAMKLTLTFGLSVASKRKRQSITTIVTSFPHDATDFECQITIAREVSLA